MSIVSEIGKRLEAMGRPPFRIVGYAGDFAALKDYRPPAVPAVYCFIAEELSQDNERMGEVFQRTEAHVVLFIVTANVADERGGAAALDIETLKSSIRELLVGWQPESCSDPIENVGGRLVRAANGYVAWEHTIAAPFYVGGET